MGRLRVLVVEDSLTVRRRLVGILAMDPELDVVGEAEDGRRAIELCAETRPDVISLDMMLPVMSGLSATEYIMAHCPTPILIVSSSMNRGELFKTYDALAAGAVDVLEKPRGDEPDGSWEEKYVTTIKLVSRIRVIRHPRGRLGEMGKQTVGVKRNAPVLRTPRDCRVVAIGASTGGPGAIAEILRVVPENFVIPILILLHVDEPFGSSFADWLDGQTVHRVSMAADGTPVDEMAGRVVVAPAGRHLVVRNGMLALIQGPERNFCRPSIDVLFESLAVEYGASTTACLLTGMGADGAAGLLKIRQAGGLTIAQNESTSIVYGMPREAVLRGAAEVVLPLGEIGPMLAGLTCVMGGNNS